MTDWLKAGNAAVITGGASGIGLAAAKRYLDAGMRVLIAQRPGNPPGQSGRLPLEALLPHAEGLDHAGYGPA